MKRILLYLLLGSIACFGGESPAGFVQLSPDPPRLSAPAIFGSCFWATDVEEYVCGAGGTVGWKQSRLDFYSSFHELDSLYSQSYSALDISFLWKHFLAELGYGFSMEWVPGGAQWSRHRVKAGGNFLGNSWYVSARAYGWLSEFENRLDWLVGGGVVKVWGRGFVEWDGSKVLVGSAVKWNRVEIKTSYTFPDFGVSLALTFSFGTFAFDGYYGFSSGKTGWFGAGMKKEIEKMTIL